MTKEEYKSLPKTDKSTLSDSLNKVTKFMTSKSDNRNKYKRILIQNIENFYCGRNNRDQVIKNLSNNSHAVGVCKTVTKRNFIQRLFNTYGPSTRFKSEISVNDTLSNYYLSNLMIAIHESNHADTNQYVEACNNKYYSGFTIIKRNGFKEMKLLGRGLNESINELYTQIQFYDSFPKCYKNIKSIDDLVYAPYNPIYERGIVANGEAYRRVGLVTKLLLIACDNDLSVSYESLKNQNASFINKSIKLDNNEYLIKNDLIYAGKMHARDFEKHFDIITGKEGNYINLLKEFDILLNQTEKMNVDEKLIENIIHLIDLYKDGKYNLMLEKGYWTKTKKSYHDLKYNNYRSFLRHMYSVTYPNITNLTNYKLSLKLDEKTGN